MTRPYPPPLLTQILNPIIIILPSQPPLLAFQMLTLARKIIITISIALSQLGPYFQTDSGLAHNAVDPVRLMRLEKLAAGNDVEATRLLRTETAPFTGNVSNSKALKAGIREWLVQNTVRADPFVQEAISHATQRRVSKLEEPPSSSSIEA